MEQLYPHPLWRRTVSAMARAALGTLLLGGCANASNEAATEAGAADLLSGTVSQRIAAAEAAYRVEALQLEEGAMGHRITEGEFAGQTEAQAGAFSWLSSPCTTLRSFSGVVSNHSDVGIFMTAKITGNLFGQDNSVGADFVWDLNHNELTTTTTGSSSSPFNVSIPPLSVSAGVAGGVAWNFRNGVEDWYGRFYEASVGVSLPNDLFGVSLNGFASGYDNNRGGIDPRGVAGVSAGLSIGVGAIPMPISASVGDGVWIPNAEGISFLADYVNNFPGVGARLADFSDGTCSRTEEAEGKCIVQFDGSLSQSLALCYMMSTSCLIGPARHIVKLPLALRALRRASLSVDEMCPGI